MSENTTDGQVVSRDGTVIAYTRRGQGPVVVLVDGALCHRAFGPATELAEALAPRFTVLTYDRRGRGASGDNRDASLPVDDDIVGLETDDLAAVLDAAGGSAMVYGISSGAALALSAADRLPGITRLAVYEAPFVVDDTWAPLTDEFRGRISAAVGAGRSGDAVKLFMGYVGTPAPVVLVMRLTPVWRKLRATGRTLPYDLAIVAQHPSGKPFGAAPWPGIDVPVLVMDGGKSPVWMRNGTKALADAVPGAAYRTLPGQTHMLKTGAIAPVLTEFFGG